MEMGSDVQRAIEFFGLPPHKTSFMTYWFDEWMDDEQLRRMLWANQSPSLSSTRSLADGGRVGSEHDVGIGRQEKAGLCRVYAVEGV